MKKFYCVTTTVYDSGRVAAAITGSIEAEIKPENHCTEKKDRIFTQIGLIAEKKQETS